MRLSISLVAFIVLVLGGSIAEAATRTWTGAGINNRFSTVENWVELAAPDTGDNLIFPATAAQYSLFCDILPDRVFNSVTFQGGDYSFVGSGKTLGITVNAGTQDLGPHLWVLNGTLFVESGAAVTAIMFGRDSNFTIDGPGTTTIALSGSFGGIVKKKGAGTAAVNWMGTGGINSITVEGGHLIGTGASVTNVTVTSGFLEGLIQTPSNLKVTGSSSEYKVSAIVTSNNFEVSNGAMFSTSSCAVQISASTVVLTGAVLNPLFSTCAGDPTRYLIKNNGAGQVVGNFVNYPEGTQFTVGGRLFRITYHAGDGNDVQILAVPGVPFDFDGDRRADISSFRPSNGTWYVRNQTGYTATGWGLSTDKLVPADYDGDGKTDEAVYRPSEGVWYVLQSSTSTAAVFRFGSETDIATPGDHDGDGKADLMIFRPADGTWWIQRTLQGLVSLRYGTNGDLPVVGDYDGDGRADIAVFRPSDTVWYLLRSQAGSFAMQFGSPTDKTVQADYDGDGKTDIAVYRPAEGVWYQYLSSTQSTNSVHWGTSTDLPAPGDYDGDARADLAIFRPSNGTWWIDRSTSGFVLEQFGVSEDMPAANAFVR